MVFKNCDKAIEILPESIPCFPITISPYLYVCKCHDTDNIIIPENREQRPDSKVTQISISLIILICRKL